MAQEFTRILKDEAATLALGAALACIVRPGLTIYLHGDLGAGKTTLVRALLGALGHAGKVKSPTYTLVEPYLIADMPVYHFDLYRFNDAEEWESAGFRDYFNAQSLCLVEWPQRASALLPAADIDVSLSLAGEGREVGLTANSGPGRQCLAEFAHD